MPTMLQILDVLSLDELLGLVDGHDVIVGGRRSKAHLVDRLAPPDRAAPFTDLRCTGHPDAIATPEGLLLWGSINDPTLERPPQPALREVNLDA